MKTAKPFLIGSLLISLIILPVGGQIPVTGSERILDKLRLNKGLEGVPEVMYSEISGDPFIFRDFKKGTLITSSEDTIEVYVRYDIYADQIHLKNNNEIYAIIHPEKVRLIEAGNLSFIYSLYSDSPKEENADRISCFILQVDGRCKLLIKKNIRIQDAEPPKLYQDAKPPKFVITGDTYFLKAGDKPAARINSKNDLFNMLDDRQDQISAFMNSNKLGAKHLEDLIKIVNYYNGL